MGVDAVEWMEVLGLNPRDKKKKISYPHDIDCCVNSKKEVTKTITNKIKESTNKPQDKTPQEKKKTTEKKTKLITNNPTQEKKKPKAKITNKITKITNRKEDKPEDDISR